MARDPLRDRFFNQMDRELADFIDPLTGKAKEDFLEAVPCPICNADHFSPLFEKNGLDFVRCKNCTFVYVNPRLRQDLVEEGYGEGGEAESNRLWADVLLSPAQQSFNDNAYAFLLDRIEEELPKKGKLLDVGCSVGHFLSLASARGYEVEGIEIEPKARTYARAEGFTVHDAKLEELALPANSYDVITMLGLIEHLPHPVNFMREAHRILRPGGIVVFNGVPNIQSLTVMMLRENARTFNGRNHLGYYSPRTLTKLATDTGFAIAHLSTYVTALDSILNQAQFLDPFDDISLALVPEKLAQTIESDRDAVEEWIIKHDLGYKIRAIAKKV